MKNDQTIKKHLKRTLLCWQLTSVHRLWTQNFSGLNLFSTQSMKWRECGCMKCQVKFSRLLNFVRWLCYRYTETEFTYQWKSRKPFLPRTINHSNPCTAVTVHSTSTSELSYKRSAMHTCVGLSICSGIMGQQRHVIKERMEERQVNERSLVSCQHFLDHCLVTYKVCVTTFSSLSRANFPQYVY